MDKTVHQKTCPHCGKPLIVYTVFKEPTDAVHVERGSETEQGHHAIR